MLMREYDYTCDVFLKGGGDKNHNLENAKEWMRKTRDGREEAKKGRREGRWREEIGGRKVRRTAGLVCCVTEDGRDPEVG